MTTTTVMSRLSFSNQDRIKTFRVLLLFKTALEPLDITIYFPRWALRLLNSQSFFETGIEILKMVIPFFRLKRGLGMKLNNGV